MKIALIQQHATKNKQENIERGIIAFKEAANRGAKLVCYAELAFEQSIIENKERVYFDRLKDKFDKQDNIFKFWVASRENEEILGWQSLVAFQLR